MLAPQQQTTLNFKVTDLATDLAFELRHRMRRLDDRVLRREIEGFIRPILRAIHLWPTFPPTEAQARACLDRLLEVESLLDNLQTE